MSGKRVAVGVAVAAVVVAACGSSKEQQAYDQLKSMCNGLVGSTVRQADNQFLSAGVMVASPLCCPPAGTLKVPIGGTCPPQTADDPECSLYYEWQAFDPSLCDAGTGACCYICEVRVMKSAAAGQDTPLCAARWLPKQPCQLPVCG